MRSAGPLPLCSARCTFSSSPAERVRGTFHTQRPPGNSFVFTITVDSHLDQKTIPDLYRQTLLNALADAPDFHIDLGDTFMTGKYRGDTPTELYLAQRYYFGLLCHSAPLFLALGNHDGEPGGRGRSHNGALMLRKRYRFWLTFWDPEPAQEDKTPSASVRYRLFFGSS